MNKKLRELYITNRVPLDLREHVKNAGISRETVERLLDLRDWPRHGNISAKRQVGGKWAD